MRSPYRFVAVLTLVGALTAYLTSGTPDRSDEARVVDAGAPVPAAIAEGAGADLLHTNNPLTGHDFTPGQVARIELLRSKFPDNSLLPTTDPEQLALRAEREAAQARTQPRIVAGVASEEEIRAFYERQRVSVRDRIALATFVLSEAQWDTRTREKYERILAFAEGQLERIDARETDSLAHRASRPG